MSVVRTAQRRTVLVTNLVARAGSSSVNNNDQRSGPSLDLGARATRGPAGAAVSAASDTTDPFAALFSSYAPRGGAAEPLNANGVIMEGSNATIRAIGVPEPGLLGLFALGIVGVLLSSRCGTAARR